MLAACSENLSNLSALVSSGPFGANSDNGQSGLNGLTLAVEQFNRAGGANGRLVEIMAKDDAQSKETAQASANQLVTAKVEAVVGPFTSGMAAVIVPITGQTGIFKSAQRSPRWSSWARMTTCIASTAPRATTRGLCQGDAQQRAKSASRGLAYDLRNRSFTQSWLDEFRTAAEGLGASVAAEVSYESSKDADFEGVVTKMLQSKPDGLLFYLWGSGRCSFGAGRSQNRSQASHRCV